ncbi:MAG: hypothetical protein ACT6RD_05755 [Brevundimonas sp.]|uniref:hypothetical protein n=1 Tax=Brevundimonas sp. TaxID=1871086 RepID=UPI004034414B
MHEPTIAAESGRATRPTSQRDYPVREYIAGMARELAQMARWDGDEGLAALLEAVEARALDHSAA